MEEFLNDVEYNRLSELLDILCSSLSEEDQECLKIFKKKDLSPSVVDQIRDGRDLAAVLRRTAVCDETRLQPVLDVLRCLCRFDLLRIAYSHERKAVKVDPLEDFLIQEATKANQDFRDAVSGSSAAAALNLPSTSGEKRPASQNYWDDSCDLSAGHSPGPSHKKRRTGRSHSSCSTVAPSSSADSCDAASTEAVPDSSESTNSSSSRPKVGVRQRYTCDVRLRVWAEYCDHERILNESVFSNKVDPLERQLERFSHASSILHSRDLGYIVCDIKFSEITYLDAFWRDYLNGSLLEALKGVFITESLKQAVGNEPIKLLVSIDDEDYEEGRNILMNNVYLDHGHETNAYSSTTTT